MTCGDGSESFLPSGIPDLQFNTLSIQLNSSDFKVDSNSGDKRGSKRIIRESQQKTRFSHSYEISFTEYQSLQ